MATFAKSGDDGFEACLSAIFVAVLLVALAVLGVMWPRGHYVYTGRTINCNDCDGSGKRYHYDVFTETFKHDCPNCLGQGNYREKRYVRDN